MAIVNELETIRKNHGGVLRAADVVQFARNPKTELHDRFTWDDNKAAEEYRLWQAREIIRVAVTIIPRANNALHRAYVSMMADRQADGGGYRSIHVVLSNPTQRALLLQEALAELNALRVKYRALLELAPVFEAIDKVRCCAKRPNTSKRKKS